MVLIYLVPIDAEIEKEADISLYSIDANALMQGLNNVGNRLNVIVLDSCRNNPYKSSSRAVWLWASPAWMPLPVRSLPIPPLQVTCQGWRPSAIVRFPALCPKKFASPAWSLKSSSKKSANVSLATPKAINCPGPPRPLLGNSARQDARLVQHQDQRQQPP